MWRVAPGLIQSCRSGEAARPPAAALVSQTRAVRSVCVVLPSTLIAALKRASCLRIWFSQQHRPCSEHPLDEPGAVETTGTSCIIIIRCHDDSYTSDLIFIHFQTDSDKIPFQGFFKGVFVLPVFIWSFLQVLRVFPAVQGHIGGSVYVCLPVCAAEINIIVISNFIIVLPTLKFSLTIALQQRDDYSVDITSLVA